MLSQFGLCFVAIFVALDVVGTLPVYLSMTQSLQDQERQRVVSTSMFVAFVVAIAFVFFGKTLFGWLGITFFDFRIAGGLVLLLVSLADLLAGPASAHSGVSGSTGIVPLAVPLITGPAVLTQLLLQVDQFGYGVTLAAMFSNYLLAWWLLRSSGAIYKILGKDGTVVVSKIAALLLAAIAVAMIRSGITEAIHRF